MRLESKSTLPGLSRFRNAQESSTRPVRRRRSQVVRQRSAKPLFPGSNPGGASLASTRLATHGSVATPCSQVLPASSTQEHSSLSSRLEANANALKRTPTATENATALLPEDADADLAAVNAAWPTLPEALKAGILAMVKAASGR